MVLRTKKNVAKEFEQCRYRSEIYFKSFLKFVANCSFL